MLGALVLLVVNAASIHVSGVAVFWYLGYRPDRWERGDPLSNLSIRRFAPSVVVAVVLLAVFATTGGVLWTHISFNHAANTAVEETLSQDRYDELELVEVQAAFNPGPRFAESQQVTITVRRPADGDYPRLSERIRRRMTAETDREPTVIVEFVESQRTPAETETETASSVDVDTGGRVLGADRTPRSPVDGAGVGRNGKPRAAGTARR